MHRREEPLRQQAVIGHGIQHARLSEEHHQHDARQPCKRAQCDDVGCQRQAAVKKCFSYRSLDVDVLPADHSGQYTGHENIENGADHQRCQDPNRKITLRLLAFLSGRRDGVKTDVRKKDVSRAGADSRKTHWRERGPIMAPVGRVNVLEPQSDDEQHDRHLDDHNDRIKARAFLDADHQDGRNDQRY